MKRKKKKIYGSIKGALARAEELLNSEQHDKSLQLYQEIIRQVPRNAEAICGLARSYAAWKEYSAAEKYMLEAIGLKPDVPGYRVDLGRIYCSMHKWDEVIRLNRLVLEKNPENISALFNMGYALRGKGAREEGLVYFEKIYRLQPDFYRVYALLCANYHSLGRMDDLLELLRSIERTVPLLPPEGQSTANFVLGRSYDQLDMFDKAFSCFQEGNRLKLGGAFYEIEYDLDVLRKVAENTDLDFLQKNRVHGNPDDSLIFILGMPRSGTSLLEQILSCHPDVAAGGELPFFYRSAFSFEYQSPERSCKKLASGYLQAVQTLRKDRPRLTDKQPDNFLYAGLIALCFPRARILHCVREPMDTCFSCYKQEFLSGHYYSYDLESLGTYYNAYYRLMRHWHNVLPGHILDVRYEDVVGDIEATVRRVLDWCGLSWNEECLRFHKSSRYVETASSDQVTKPIYSSSVDRWTYYEQHLKPLKNGLLPELVRQG